MTQQTERDRRRIQNRLNDIEHSLSEYKDFIEFGASRDFEYRMAEAHIEALKIEREKLKEILGDL